MSNAGIAAAENLRREARLAAERAVELERRLALASPEVRSRAWRWHEVHISDRKDGVLWIWVPVCDGDHADKYLWEDGKTSNEVVDSRIQRTVRLAEYGGGLAKTGHVQIVCGLQGEKLKPIERHSSFGADHAVFFVREALVVNYHRRHGEGYGEVSLVEVVDEGQHIALHRELLYRFVDSDDSVEVWSDRTRSIQFPQAAVDAARKKANSYYCNEAFYVEAEPERDTK